MAGRAKRNAARKKEQEEQAKREKANICGAKTRSDKICKNSAGKGTSHPGSGRCKTHAGATRSHEISEAHKEVNGMAKAMHVSPQQAVQAALSLAAGQLAYATSKVAALDEDEMYEEHVNAETRIPQVLPNIWLVVQERCMKDMTKFAKVASDMGIAERDMSLKENQTMLVAGLLKSVIADLDLSPEQQKKIAPSIRKHLPQMQSGEENPILDGSARELVPA